MTNTEDTSPENLRKFLESDDPALVLMGLSMAKGSGVPEEMLGLVAGLYMWDDDKGVRAAAKSAFMKHAPEDVKTIIKEKWKANYRTRQHADSWFCKKCNQPRTNRQKGCRSEYGYCVHFFRVNFLEELIKGLKNTSLDSIFLWVPSITSDINWKIKDNIAKIITKHYPSESLRIFTELLMHDDRNVRLRAVKGLERISDGKSPTPRTPAAISKRAVERLVETLKDVDTDEQVRIAVQGVLKEIRVRRNKSKRNK